MTLDDYMVWMIGMAIATILILTLGTLAAADLLPSRSQKDSTDADADDAPAAPVRDDHEHRDEDDRAVRPAA